MSEAYNPFAGLGVALDFAFNSLVGKLNHSLKEVGLPLNHAQFVILQRLFRQEGISQRGMARELGKDVAAITRSLNHLEENGFITRRAMSGSRNGIFLTEKALLERKKINDAIAIATKQACAGISEEEYDKGMQFLSAIHKNLTAIIPPFIG